MTQKKFKNIIILCAGKSTRFWPLMDKNLFNFLGASVTEYQIKRFLPYGEKLTVVVNEGNGDNIQRQVKKLGQKNIQLVKQVGVGQASGLISCQNTLKGEALVVNNDDFFDYDSLLAKILAIKAGYEIILTAKKVERYLPGGYFKLQNDKVIEIVEKPGPEKMPSPYFRLVVDYFADFGAFIKAVQAVKSDKDDYYEQGINKYISALIGGINKYLSETKEKKTTFVKYDGYYYTLKYPWQVLAVMNYFLAGLKNEVKIGKNVKISRLAKIVGPTYIGDNTVVGDYALVRESHIGKNCLIGGYCEVTRSYLGDNVMLHRNYIGDSVLDNGVFMGSGAATANFRFDGRTIRDSGLTKLGALIGERAKIGVNATILPGVKIGKNTFVGPGEIIDSDIEDNKFVFKGKIKENKP